MTATPQLQRREEYLRRNLRTAQLIAEGFVSFGVHEGGRDKYTPMEELDSLCDWTDSSDEGEPKLRKKLGRPFEVKNKLVSNAPCRSHLAVDLYKQGRTVSQIIADLGLKESGVRSAIKRHLKREGAAK